GCVGIAAGKIGIPSASHAVAGVLLIHTPVTDGRRGSVGNGNSADKSVGPFIVHGIGTRTKRGLGRSRERCADTDHTTCSFEHLGNSTGGVFYFLHSLISDSA